MSKEVFNEASGAEVYPLAVSFAHIDVGAERPFSVLHISDTHLTEAFDDEEEPIRLFAAKRAVTFCGRQWEALEASVDFASRFADMIVNTGDLIDFASEGNMAAVRKFYEIAGDNVVFAPGNHEWQWRGADRDVYSERAIGMCRATYPCDLSFSSRVLNGVNFIAMDNSVANVAGRPGITEAQVEAFAGEVAKGLPIVLCLHVPIYTPDVWKTYCQYWRNRECRYADGFPTEPPQMNGITDDFIAYLKTEPLLKAILSGHEHYSLDERFSPTATQFLVAGNYAGAVRHLLIT
jgi:3',5'-cyclic AMP phosphodiesterase CpdA